MTSARGLVFNIQRFSTHDGPGLRSTVFFKGCPLQCAWCHNPESQATGPELMVSPRRCVHCGSCVEVCPTGAAAGGRVPCSRCGRCAQACPAAAREVVGREMAVEEVMDEIARDRVFYEESGGGVTFSGGEPLAQPGFLLACLEACRARGFHTALDTCGYAGREVLLAAATLADLVLFDVKLMDEADHERLTGGSNRAILANLRALSEAGAALWLRVPVIPGINDDPENMARTAALAAGLPGVRRVGLLPYHGLGTDKAARLGLRNSFQAVPSPGTALLSRLAEPFRRRGLEVTLGG